MLTAKSKLKNDIATLNGHANHITEAKKQNSKEKDLIMQEKETLERLKAELQLQQTALESEGEILVALEKELKNRIKESGNSNLF